MFDLNQCLRSCLLTSVIRDRLPRMSSEDVFVLSKLFEVESLIDYRAICDETPAHGILKHITALPVPRHDEIILDKKPPKDLKRPFNEPLLVNDPK